jgi:hypothetical protein
MSVWCPAADGQPSRNDPVCSAAPRTRARDRHGLRVPSPIRSFCQQLGEPAGQALQQWPGHPAAAAGSAPPRARAAADSADPPSSVSLFSRKPVDSEHLVSRRAYRADRKSLMDLVFSAKNSGISNCAAGKLAQAINDNPLKMMDVGSLSGDPTPGSNFAALRALAQRGSWQNSVLSKNPYPLRNRGEGLGVRELETYPCA